MFLRCPNIRPLRHLSASTFGTNMSENIVASKRAAAYQAIDDYLSPSFKVVGIGSGSTVIFCVDRIEQKAKSGELDVSNMTFVSTGFQSKQLILDAGLQVKEIDQFAPYDIDIVFDGADEIDSDLNCIKGGGACLLEEKLVGKCAKTWIVVADHSKYSKCLGEHWHQGVPIEVVPQSVKKITHQLKGIGAKQITLRQGGKVKAGPVVTDNGNVILDTDFGIIEPTNVTALTSRIKNLCGVVEVGLFDYAHAAYIGREDGSFSAYTRKNSTTSS